MASQVKEDHVKVIEQSVDENDGVLSKMSDALNEALDEVGNKMKKIKNSALRFLDEVTHDVSDIIDKFLVSLPIAQVIGPGSDDENLGNNVHFQNPFQTNGEPYRFGLHITRDDLGYKITRIFENTIAYHAKLQENDILTRLGDTDLSTTNLVKVVDLFYKVGNPFKLSFLREVDSGERVEIVIEITITSDEVGQSVDILVTRPRYIRPSRNSLTPNYITQDPDGESQKYVNMASNGSLVLGNEPVSFVFVNYLTFTSNGPRFPSVLKTLDGNLAFDINQQKMMDFIARNIECYMLNATLRNDGSYLFEKYRQDDDDDSYFLHNSNGKIRLSRFDLDSIPVSAQFVLYPTNEDDTTSSDDEHRPSTTHRRGDRD